MPQQQIAFVALLRLLFPEILAVLVVVALCAFAAACYRLEAKRRAEQLQRDIAQYWARRRLNERREAAAELHWQRLRAKSEAFYRENGYYPAFWDRLLR